MARNATPLTPGQRLYRHAVVAARFERRAGVEATTAAGIATRKYYLGRADAKRREFVAELRRQREAMGLTHEQLAASAGLSAADIGWIERGEQVPTDDAATRLAWGIDMAAGLGRDDL